MSALRGIKESTNALSALVLIGITTLTCVSQILLPGEVRITSRSYLPRSTIRSEARLVQLEVVVRDRYGRAVSGLTENDFAVYDSGRRRDLTAFSVQTSDTSARGDSNSSKVAATSIAQPVIPAKPAIGSAGNQRWTALLFDDINTSPGDLAHAKGAAARFVKEAVANGDRVGVFTTSMGGDVGFTRETENILDGIARIQSHPRTAPGGLAMCPRMTAYEAYLIVRNDPTAMKAKVAEACQCGGGPSCQVDDIPANELLNPTSRYGGNAYETGTLSTLIDSVRAQAQQTWDQTCLASQLTLAGIKASLEELVRRPGQRMLLLASAGFLSGPLEREEDTLVDEALRSGVVINSLDAKGLYSEAPGGPINESVEVVELPVSTSLFQMQSLGDRLDSLDSLMAKLAESTGGLLFRDNNDLDLGFRQVGIVPSNIYLLAFPPVDDGKYHKIKVELKKGIRGLVQVRPGYFSRSKASATSDPLPGAEPDRIDAEMSGFSDKRDVPATDSETVTSSDSGGRRVTVQTHVDVEKLPFKSEKDRHTQSLTFVVGLFNSQGSFVTGKEANMALALRPESFEYFSKTGINGVLTLEVHPGMYRLRVVVQEAVHGNITALSKDLSVR